jgi:hypothetical protein
MLNVYILEPPIRLAFRQFTYEFFLEESVSQFEVYQNFFLKIDESIFFCCFIFMIPLSSECHKRRALHVHSSDCWSEYAGLPECFAFLFFSFLFFFFNFPFPFPFSIIFSKIVHFSSSNSHTIVMALFAVIGNLTLIFF